MQYPWGGKRPLTLKKNRTQLGKRPPSARKRQFKEDPEARAFPIALPNKGGFIDRSSNRGRSRLGGGEVPGSVGAKGAYPAHGSFLVGFSEEVSEKPG